MDPLTEYHRIRREKWAINDQLVVSHCLARVVDSNKCPLRHVLEQAKSNGVLPELMERFLLCSLYTTPEHLNQQNVAIQSHQVYRALEDMVVILWKWEHCRIQSTVPLPDHLQRLLHNRVSCLPKWISPVPLEREFRQWQQHLDAGSQSTRRPNDADIEAAKIFVAKECGKDVFSPNATHPVDTWNFIAAYALLLAPRRPAPSHTGQTIPIPALSKAFDRYLVLQYYWTHKPEPKPHFAAYLWKHLKESESQHSGCWNKIDDQQQ
jgi:hypothetical protein